MDVPLFSPLAQNRALADEFLEAFSRISESGQFILGREVECFEREVAEWHGMSGAVGVSSGTDALLVALMAEGIGPGDEVIVPSFTFFGTAGVVARLGATPVFVDVCPDCFLLQPDTVARAVTRRTRAVIPVHLFGQACDVPGIREALGGNTAVVIEDAAQAMGARWGQQRVGGLGDWGAFSFFPTKNLGGFGDGGMVLTSDPGRAETARWLRNHGMHPRYVHEQVGGNFRLDALQAALLRVKLPEVEGYLRRRQENVNYYLEGLGDHHLVRPGSSASCACLECGQDDYRGRILLPRLQRGQTPAWNQFTIRIRDGRRDELKKHLAEQGIGSEIYYPLPLHQQPCFKLFNNGAPLPHTETLCTEVLSLPVYPELLPDQMDHVIRAINEWLA